MSVNQQINRPNNNRNVWQQHNFFPTISQNPILLLSINIIATKFQKLTKNGLRNSGSRKKANFMMIFFCWIYVVDFAVGPDINVGVNESFHVFNSFLCFFIYYKMNVPNFSQKLILFSFFYTIWTKEGNKGVLNWKFSKTFNSRWTCHQSL